MLKIISMKVNGKQRELAVDVRESLADALRNRLALTECLSIAVFTLQYGRTARVF